MRKVFSIFFLLTLVDNMSSLSGQDSFTYTDQVFNKKIKSVQLFKEGWNLSYPIMKLGSSDRLVLHFDLLGNEPEIYYYSFIHCNREWQKSDINSAEYLDGFGENQIEKYEPSFNTRISYYHYSVAFPNDRINIKLSGNYVLIIYPASNPEKPVLTARFMVTEDITKIGASAQRPQLTEYYNTGQQVTFTINYAGISINDPVRNISSSILQNGQWFDAKTDLKPDLVGNNEAIYNSLSTRNIFPGGNEFRYFDTKNIRYQSEFIRKIDFVENSYHVFLVPSENREFKPYFYSKDLNGKYFVAVQDGRNMDTDADYLYVYFTLPCTYKIDGGSMYVSGALNNWAFNDENIMTYDPGKAEYQATMLLKQGWYNYEYIFIREGDKSAEPSLFEGNHYEAENDYLILVYYRNPGDRYDRIIGSCLINSSKQVRN